MKNIGSSKIELCPEQREELLRVLKARFEKNMAMSVEECPADEKIIDQYLGPIDPSMPLDLIPRVSRTIGTAMN